MILLIAIFAFSYMMASPDDRGVPASVYGILTAVSKFFKAWLERSRIGIVSAGCCERTKDNQVCKDVSQDDCAIGYNPASCDNVAGCRQGCCINNNEGLCMINTLNRSCSSLWKDDASCNVVECRKGCCSLPFFDSSWYMTDKRCEKLSAFYGVNKNFMMMNETECIDKQKNQEEGACVYQLRGETLCKLTTKDACLSITNNIYSFHNSTLCSNAELNTSCRKQARTGCVSGKKEVYWFDSCGNRENIYDSDLIKSWNNGMILSKNQSCNPTSGNIENKECGNCNKEKGSQCESYLKSNVKPSFGEYICGDLNCVYKGKHYTNGETWCEYESYIGDGKDVVGSRSFKKTCENGIVKTDPCEDMRQEVCAEKMFDGKNVAECRINRWRECLTYNSIEDAAEQELRCKQNPDCEFREMSIFDSGPTKMCTPIYPSGLDFAESNRDTRNEQCSVGNFNCTVVFVCGKCEQNCNCLSPEFTETINDACMSMGDCGVKANIMGEVTTGGYSLVQINKNPPPSFFVRHNVTIKNYPPALSQTYLDSLKIYSIPVEGQKATYLESGTKKSFIFSFILAGMGFPGTGGSDFSTQWWERMIVGTLLSPFTFGFAFLIWIWGEILNWFGISFINDIYGEIASWIGFGEDECDVEQKVVQFRCLPWTQPYGGQNCEKCDDKVAEGIPCSKYRCQSLGAACELVNEGTGREACLWIDRTDAIPPTVTLEMLSPGYKLEQQEIQAELKTTEGSCIESMSGDVMNVKTNEYASCKWDYYDNLYDDMRNSFAEGLDINHNFSLSFPNKAALVWELNLTQTQLLNESIQSILENFTENLQLFIKCKDKNGNERMKIVRTCISETDSRESKLLFSTPRQDGYFPYNKTEIPLTLFLNEPADCRYSYNEKAYGEMDKNFSCKKGLAEVTRLGWMCNTTIKNENNRTYYVRCLDQPWKQNERNANTKSFVFNLKESSSQLQISSIEPNTTVMAGTEPTTVTLKAVTSGGANGKAFCKYSFDANSSVYNFFTSTGNTIHTSIFDQSYEGYYKARVQCTDEAGNSASKETSYEVQIDRSSSAITRVYKNQGSLYIHTEENSECKYSFLGCQFNWTNASSFSGLEKEHSASWDVNHIYYVKCKDIWDNYPLGCSIIIKPEEVQEAPQQ